jgi:hypothetical protein
LKKRIQSIKISQMKSVSTNKEVTQFADGFELLLKSNSRWTQFTTWACGVSTLHPSRNPEHVRLIATKLTLFIGTTWWRQGWTDSMSWPNRFSSIFTSHTCTGIEYGKPISGWYPSGSCPHRGWMNVRVNENFDFVQEMWMVDRHKIKFVQKWIPYCFNIWG